VNATGSDDPTIGRSGRGTVALVDDHHLLVDTLRLALQGRHDVIEVPVTHDPAGVPATVRRHGVDVAVADLALGSGRDGTQLVAAFRHGGARVIVVTGVTDPQRQLAALDAGAEQVVQKSAPLPQLLLTIEAALGGRALPGERQRRELQDRLHRLRRERGVDLESFARLTPREREVLAALVAGHRARRIAVDASVSITTVRSQIRSILAKLEVSSQLEAVALAREAGWSPDLR